MTAPVSPSTLTTLEWAQERLTNSERLAARWSFDPTGQEHTGWLEDVRYWRAIVEMLAQVDILTRAQQAAEQESTRLTTSLDEARHARDRHADAQQEAEQTIRTLQAQLMDGLRAQQQAEDEENG